MRKCVLTIVFFFGALLVVACNKWQINKTDMVPAASGETAAVFSIGNGKEQNTSYGLIKKTYIEKNIEASYPQLSGLKDKNIQKKINEMLNKEALLLCNSSQIDEVHAECNYEIKWKSEKVLSGVFTGYCQKDGTPRQSIIFSPFNIDITTGNKIELKDIVRMDEGFVKKVKAGMFIGGCPEIEIENIPELSNESVFDAITEVGEFYFTKDSLGINVTVSQFLGDNVQFEARYQDISDNIKKENAVWQEFSWQH